MNHLGKIINAILEKVGIDKILHFLVGYAIVMTGLMYSFAAGCWCFVAVFVLSVIKEVAIDDKADWLDAFAGIVGGIAGFILYVPKDMML